MFAIVFLAAFWRATTGDGFFQNYGRRVQLIANVCLIPLGMLALYSFGFINSADHLQILFAICFSVVATAAIFTVAFLISHGVAKPLEKCQRNPSRPIWMVSWVVVAAALLESNHQFRAVPWLVILAAATPILVATVFTDLTEKETYLPSVVSIICASIKYADAFRFGKIGSPNLASRATYDASVQIQLSESPP
jgi:hypothetical protein